jgi:hypothetical protein
MPSQKSKVLGTYILQVSLAIKYNQGWAFTISDVSWRGKIVIEPDAQATITFRGSYQGGLTAVSLCRETISKNKWLIGPVLKHVDIERPRARRMGTTERRLPHR